MPGMARSFFRKLKAFSSAAPSAKAAAAAGGQTKTPLGASKYDKFLLHPVLGLLALIGALFLLFSSLFWLAEPFMSFIDSIFGLMGLYAEKLRPSLFRDFLIHGIIAAAAAVLIFTPQIFILFFGLSLLENSGYLSRAAVLANGFFSLFGLSGRALVPFLSGYGCAIPAAMAARSLPSKRERTLCLFALPFMSCQARLPVYTLLLSFFFLGAPAWKPGLSLALIYFASLFLGLLAASFLDRILGRKARRQPLPFTLPPLRQPSLQQAMRRGFSGARRYLTGAAPLVFIFALAVWAGSYFPEGASAVSEADRLEGSWLAQLGRWMEPVFLQIGLDWRAGAALLSAFVAREVFVSALALLLRAAPSEGAGLLPSLMEKMQGTESAAGEALWTAPSVFALIALFMLSLQCLSTTAVVMREGGWRLAAFQFAALNGIAYIGAVLVYNIAKAF